LVLIVRESLNYSKMVEAGAVVGDEITINIDLETATKQAGSHHLGAQHVEWPHP
jgi:hypothetical protein